jgi:hypothetical protein
VVDDVVARPATDAGAQSWRLPEGAALPQVRTTLIDGARRVVAVSDARHRGDRAKLTFATGPATRRVANDAHPESWTVDLAEELLRLATPASSRFVRGLVDEGGTATAARLKELTGVDALQYMALSLNSALRKVSGSRATTSGGSWQSLARTRRTHATAACMTTRCPPRTGPVIVV